MSSLPGVSPVLGIVILGLGIPVNCVVVKWAASRNSLA